MKKLGTIENVDIFHDSCLIIIHVGMRAPNNVHSLIGPSIVLSDYESVVYEYKNKRFKFLDKYNK